MNSTTRGLLRDIVANPRDNGLRLILADYLEEQHQGHQPEVRAAMIREQVPPRGAFRTSTGADSDSYMVPWKASTAWGAAFPRRITLDTFVGGLPSLAHINAEDFCSVAQDVVDLFPLEKVFLHYYPGTQDAYNKIVS